MPENNPKITQLHNISTQELLWKSNNIPHFPNVSTPCKLIASKTLNKTKRRLGFSLGTTEIHFFSKRYTGPNL